MAQNTTMAAGTGALNTAPVAIPADTTYNFAIFTSGGAAIPAHVGVAVHLDTPGDDQPFAHLSPTSPVLAITGPIEVIFKRVDSPVPVGVVQYT